jgi:hypothetical protein
MKYLTHAAVITCLHGGMVQFNPVQPSWEIMGQPVLTVDAVENAAIVGCPQMGPGIKPCTKVVTITVGRAAHAESDGRIPLLNTLDFITDGNPPGKCLLVYNPIFIADQDTPM